MFRSVVFVCVLLCAVIAPASATVGSSSEEVGSPAYQAQVEHNGTNTNDTVNETRHRDPDTVGQEGDIEALQSWLIGQLAGRLGDSAIQLSQGEYDRARQLLGDDFNERLDQFVDVAGETDTSRTFDRTRENQREMTNATQDYRDTYEKYREVRENGDNERARELARELERDASRVQTNAEQTRNGYDGLGNQTGQNFTGAKDAVTEVEDNITETQEDVRQSTFEETDLSVSADGETVSFLDPLELTGTLRTENGTEITDEEIRLRVGNRTYETTTDDEGAFTIEYRPTELPVNASEVTVEYRPIGSSPYLNSSEKVPVDVEQVTPSASVRTSPNTAAFNDTVTVRGEVSAEGIGAPVPVGVYLDGERVTTTRSDGNGSFQTNVRVPAGVADGTQPITVRVGHTDRAVGNTSASTDLNIEETPTTMTIEASSTDGSTIRVEGVLTADDGQAVTNQPVSMSVSGATVETVRTNDEGRYVVETDVDDDAVTNGSVSVGVTFDGEGTNLGPSTATTTVALTGIGGQNAESESPLEALGTEMRVLLAIGLFVLSILVAMAFHRYRSGQTAGDESVVSTESAQTEPTDDESESTVAYTTLLARAREQLAAGQSSASIATLYAAMRVRFRNRVGTRGLTHWEFYRTAKRVLADDEQSFLERLTSAYEQAVFSPAGVTHETAEELLDDATHSQSSNESSATE